MAQWRGRKKEVQAMRRGRKEQKRRVKEAGYDYFMSDWYRKRQLRHGMKRIFDDNKHLPSIEFSRKMVKESRK
jgi:hypothetical protein